MSNSAAGGPDRPYLNDDEQAEVDAKIADLQQKFPRGWDFAHTYYPSKGRWQYVGKPQPPLTADPYVFGDTAEQLAAGIKLRLVPEGSSGLGAI